VTSSAMAAPPVPSRAPGPLDAVSPTELTLGGISVRPAVVLAPMAGVTNRAFRTLCREQSSAGLADVAGVVPGVDGPPGLFVCEMVTSRGIVERQSKSLGMLQFDPAEPVRSVQLYGVDPHYLAEATRIVCGEYGVGHVDLNFGCPVPKVTRKGGGAALPVKRNLVGQILAATVAAAAPYGVPVTVKTRIGIDDDHPTSLDTGRIAADSGVVAIALHARTAEQHYSGEARWAAIAELVQALTIPVLGNGDIWEAGDAVRMMRQTGCAGVVVGRGCLGRPWLFRDLSRVLASGQAQAPVLPTLLEVAGVMRRHAELLAGLMGEDKGLRDFRKHVAWYLKGFEVGGEIRAAGGMVSSLAELDTVLARLDGAQEYPATEIGRPRGRQGSPRRVVLPEGWLDDADGLGLDLSDAEDDTSGG
jgi:nifR3 family TIM-barrel protein